ncbi:hypothetical protein [Formosa sp. A9]|uniref:hypothetical protein n=1 Tax=Formosa sp. A9 TaxID=3442641 RepID=UPI003EBE5A99
MVKSLVKLVLKAIILAILFLLVVKSLNPLFTEAKDSIWNNFYERKKNSVDILILGNSHANAGLDNAIIEAKLNSNIVSLATRGQNIYQAYYCALEAYNYQSPKVLIIENFLFYERLTMEAFVNQDPTINDYMKRYLTYEGKKFGKVKIEESRAFFNGNMLENMFPAIKKHDRWPNIKSRLYHDKETSGQKVTSILSPSSVIQYKQQQDFDLKTYNILPEEKKALEDIIQLAISKGTEQIILLTIPFYKEYRNKIDYNSLDEPLKAIAASNDKVKYLDLNAIYPNLDYTFFSNEPVGYNQHLNYKGAIKISNYVSNKIYSKEKKKKVEVVNSVEGFMYNNTIKDTLTDGTKLLGNLERLNGEKLVDLELTQGDEKQLVLSGWLALEDKQSNFRNRVYVVLKKDDNFIYLSSPNQLKQIIRKDVTKYYKKDKELYHNSGFQVNIPSNLLEKGKYKIFLCMKLNNNEIIFKQTYKTVTIN